MESGINENWLEQLKSKNEIVSVVSKYVKLQNKGKNFWGCCPFHHEKTPSFCVNQIEQFYHCFGCKESGDVIKFIEKIESCDFMQAIEILAKNAGMEIPEFSSGNEDVAKRKQRKTEILKVLDLAQKHYEQNLYKDFAKPAQEYVKKRGLTKRDLDKFHIGYAKDWTELITYLKSNNVSNDIMKEAGLIESKNDHYYDVLGERLVFPIFNYYDECVGFSARSLVPTTFAKYKNTATTPVFDKGKTVYGINILRKLKQSQGVDKIIIVEGQMDVIAMHRAGFENAVACMGTALTSDHARILHNISENVVMCLDGDSAGQKAMMKAVDILAQNNFNVKAVKIPNGQDPDEYIKEFGKDSLKELIDGADDYVEFKIKNKLGEFDLSKNHEKAQFINIAMDIINNLKTNSEKQIYIELISKLSGIAVPILMKDASQKELSKIDEPQTITNDADNAEIRAIKFILASLCYKKEYANFDFDLNKYLINNSYIKLYQLLKSFYLKKETFLISCVFDNFNLSEEPNLQDIINFNFELVNNGEKYYEECIWKIRETYLRENIKKLNSQYNLEINESKKLEILKEINEEYKKLKNKVLED